MKKTLDKLRRKHAVAGNVDVIPMTLDAATSNEVKKLEISKAVRYKKKIVEKALKTVYDPEFPIIDIFTLGLIYDIKVQEKEKKINILMTFTTPACPMAEMLQEMVKNAINEKCEGYTVVISITFDPMRNIDMIKDPDLKRMFE
ncbi:MAG: hypothetical protein CO170_03860 [candidate division SR1 bacterium CG_4_9_14_3_um_filter_40_9]|nr:MAG: hypothetical protein CO170_03860 [candidate division SR1 bacterium CG_4_9_14_3_um_filter_40_9]